MKKQLISRIVATALIATAAWLASGCEKEQVAAVAPSELHQLPGRYKQVIDLRDGDSRVSLGIASDNEVSLKAFQSELKMVALYERSTETSESATLPVSAETANAYSEANAIHITVLEEILAPQVQGFQLVLESPEDVANGKANLFGTYYGGPYYFYSWEAPHYFKVTPLNGNCVSAWLHQAGSTWTPVSWAGGSGGNYLCSNAWAASSSVNSLDYRLKAQGAKFSVYWY